jgi:hypothetical protein
LLSLQQKIAGYQSQTAHISTDNDSGGAFFVGQGRRNSAGYPIACDPPDLPFGRVVSIRTSKAASQADETKEERACNKEWRSSEGYGEKQTAPPEAGPFLPRNRDVYCCMRN